MAEDIQTSMQRWLDYVQDARRESQTVAPLSYDAWAADRDAQRAGEDVPQYTAAMEGTPLDIDTSESAMDASFQELLAALDARLAALTREEGQEQGRAHDMGY